jgi:hypothetical protein
VKTKTTRKPKAPSAKKPAAKGWTAYFYASPEEEKELKRGDAVGVKTEYLIAVRRTELSPKETGKLASLMAAAIWPSVEYLREHGVVSMRLDAACAMPSGLSLYPANDNPSNR